MPLCLFSSVFLGDRSISQSTTLNSFALCCVCADCGFSFGFCFCLCCAFSLCFDFHFDRCDCATAILCGSVFVGLTHCSVCAVSSPTLNRLFLRHIDRCRTVRFHISLRRSVSFWLSLC
jgi:hypothetical protein